MVGFIIFNLLYTDEYRLNKFSSVGSIINNMFLGNILPKINSNVRFVLGELYAYSNTVEKLNKTTIYFLTVVYNIWNSFNDKEVLDSAILLNTKEAVKYFIFLTSKLYFNKDTREEYSRFLQIINNPKSNHAKNTIHILKEPVFIRFALGASSMGYFSFNTLLRYSFLDLELFGQDVKTAISIVNKYNVYTAAVTTLHHDTRFDFKDSLNRVADESYMDRRYKFNLKSYVKNSPYYTKFEDSIYSRYLLDINSDVEVIGHDPYNVRLFLLSYLKLYKKNVKYGVLDIEYNKLSLDTLRIIEIYKTKFNLDHIYIFVVFPIEVANSNVSSSFSRRLELLRKSKNAYLYHNVKLVYITYKHEKTTVFHCPNVINLKYPTTLGIVEDELNVSNDELTVSQHQGLVSSINKISKYKNVNEELYLDKLYEICKNYHFPLEEKNNSNLEKDSYYNVEYINVKNTDIEDIISKTMEYVNRHDYINLSFLLYGISGTGKTMFATELAEKLGFELKSLSASSFLSKWVGETEENIANVFSNNNPKSIILIDEAECLFTNRDNTSANHEAQMVNEFLVRLERFKGILILTTNSIENFDKAFLRRITVKLEFLPIHKDKISKLINHIVKSEKLKKDYDLTNINNELENLTLGMIGNVLKQKTFYNFNSTKILIDKLKEELSIIEENRKVGFSI